VIKMGKNLIQQARGKGGPTYRSPKHRFYGKARHPPEPKELMEGIVRDLIKCPGHTAPLSVIEYSNGEFNLMICPEDVRVGQTVKIGTAANIVPGNTLLLKNIPDGTIVFNVENVPGDGGKFARSSGVFAKVIGRQKDKIRIMLPSKKEKLFNLNCRAAIGTVAGGGRKEKPFIKAGFRHKAMRAKNKLYPRVSGTAMNAIDHPFGGSRSSRKGRSSTTSRNAPHGRKVGLIAARQSGRRKGKRVSN